MIITQPPNNLLRITIISISKCSSNISSTKPIKIRLKTSGITQTIISHSLRAADTLLSQHNIPSNILLSNMRDIDHLREDSISKGCNNSSTSIRISGLHPILKATREQFGLPLTMNKLILTKMRCCSIASSRTYI